MKDHDCVRFLQWALPRLRMRWQGLRKVRRQVCKRIQRRLDELELNGECDYRAYLQAHPEEWHILDGLCRVTISRFYRDKQVFAFLARQVLPDLARGSLACGEHTLRLWSAGCGSGEEPYTLALLWGLALESRFSELEVRILATDSDPNMIRRAQEARYSASSLKDLPTAWRDAAFVEAGEHYSLRAAFRRSVEYRCQDLRETVPEGPFDLVLCRNLAFTYWDRDLQLDVARRIVDTLIPEGGLVIGAHETLPEGLEGLVPWAEALGVFERVRGPEERCGLLCE